MGSSSFVSATDLPTPVANNITSAMSTYLASSDDAVTASGQSMVTQVTSPAQPSGAVGPILSEMEVGLTKLPNASGVSPWLSPATSASTKVLGEIPTPQSGYENYYYGHPNPIQSSRLDSGSSTNLREHNLDGMPQHYGLHNLNRHSLFLADGTEHSYFTLPTDYPLERVVPEPVFAVYDDRPDGCSNELVTVFASTPEKQSYEEKQQDSEQLLKCVGEAPGSDQTVACLNYISHLFDCTPEQKQQNEEKESANVQQLRGTQWTVPVIYERRKEWDPGIHTSLSSTPTSDIDGFLQTSTLPKSGNFILNDELVGEDFLKCVSKLRDPQSNLFVILDRREVWDPGASAPLHSSKGSAVSILQQLHNKNFSSMQEFSLEKGSHVQWDPGIKLILYELWWLSKGYTYLIDTAAIMCDPPTNLIQQRRPITAWLHVWPYKLLSSLVYTWDPRIALSSYRYSWLESGTAWHKAVPALVWSPSPFFADLQYHLPMIKAYSVWDPGMLNQLDMMLDKSAVPNLVHSTRTTFKPSIFVGQPIDLKQFWDQLLLLQSHSWYNTLNAFLQVHYCCFPLDTHCAYSERVQQLAATLACSVRQK